MYLVGGGGGGSCCCCQPTPLPPIAPDSWVGVLTGGVEGVDGELVADDEAPPVLDFFSADFSGLALRDAGSLGPCARTQPGGPPKPTTKTKRNKGKVNNTILMDMPSHVK